MMLTVIKKGNNDACKVLIDYKNIKLLMNATSVFCRKCAENLKFSMLSFIITKEAM